MGALHHLAREFRAVAPDQPASLPSRGICSRSKNSVQRRRKPLTAKLISAMVLAITNGEGSMPNEAASGPMPGDVRVMHPPIPLI